MFLYPRIRDCREDNDKSQEEIAKLLETTQQTYSMWERGKREIPLHNLIELSKLYNVSLDYLAGLPKGLPYGKSKTR